MNNVYLTHEITKNNHLQYWFNNNELQHWRSDPLESAHMSVGHCRVPNKTFLRCLMSTAIDIKCKNKGEFYLFLSGGLDSEVAIRTFMYTGVKFQPIILKFINDLNVEDVQQAITITNELGLDPFIEEIDPFRFFESGRWLDMAKKYQSYTFYQQLLLQAAEGLAAPMLTVDAIDIVKFDDVNWGFVKNEDQDGCWHRFIEKTGIPAYNNFYTYDPDTFLAFLSSPTINQLINNKIYGKLSWESSKNEIYAELTPWTMSKRIKRHGMERMMNIWTYVKNYVDNEIYNNHKIFQFNINDLQKNMISGHNTICNTI